MTDRIQSLSFEPDAIDAIVCLNGNVPTLEFFESFAHHPLIAADGALMSLMDVNVQPEFVVGDLDSIPNDVLTELRGVSEIIFEPDQDTNDFEKSIRFAQSQLWNSLLVVGMHGGDLEHTLNNWSVLMRFARTMKISVLDRDRVAVPVFNSIEYNAQPDELISLVPQPSARITTQGLKWALSEEDLHLGTREGARNRAISETVCVTVHSGSLLFFCESRLPLTPTVR